MPLFRASRYRLAPAIPDLTEIQYKKFNEFLSKGIAQSLHAINPIHFRRKNVRVVLYPNLYQFVPPKITERQAFRERKSYTMSLYVPGHAFLGNIPLEQPQWLYFGELPVMTRRGHFVINGCARVLAHQIVRRPGLYFKEKLEGTGIKEKRVIWADFICQRGSWVRVQRDKKKRLWFCLKNLPKIDLDHLIEAMEAVEARSKMGTHFTDDHLSALGRIEQRLDLPIAKKGEAAFKFLYTRFKNPKIYTLGASARYQINCKLHVAGNSLQLTANDLRQTKEYLLNLDQNHYVPDDIDNLSNRRVRTSSELYQVKLNEGLVVLSKNVRQKVNFFKRITSATKLVDAKPFSQAFRECFSANPLAQFLDQVNPLSDVTHKRRIYATGPGGVSQENASLEMRSIHPTYYGRICPIETPEGKRAGLVNSLTVLGRVNEEGSLQTPYYRMFKGQIQTRTGLHYVTTAQEQGNALTIAPLDLGRDRGQVVSGTTNVPARIATELQEDFVNISREKLEYIGIAPPQLMSIATSLIPFLEHDDANRALMGSNMQRQTVPVLRPARPIVSTGLEGLVVGESGHALIADKSGIVSYVSGSVIKVDSVMGYSSNNTATFAKMGENSISPKSHFPGFTPAMTQDRRIADTPQMALTRQWIAGMSKNWLNATSHVGSHRRRYELQTYERSNQETALTQRPAVHEGQWVQRGDLLADCAASVGGQLALGHNLLVAYVPWEGYNFEDAVVISERLIYEDLYTTLHIEKFDTESRKSAESQDGVEVITRDLSPKLSAWDNGVLDKDGVIRVGRWVETGDILVRKIIRRKSVPLNPYVRLLYDILQTKAPVNKDVSFRVPRGVRGRVVNTQIIERVEISPQIRAEYKQLGFTNIPETLPAKVRVFIAEKRRIQVGDKVAGRHGNKGIISCILPRQDMPYLPDGRAVDMVLNPLGVPSRMNVGQIFECLLGLAGSYLNQEFRITPFDEIFGAEASRSIVFLKLYQARLKTHKKWLFQPNFPGKIRVFDGRTGECFDQFVTVGCAYMLKLVHLVDEKIHARTTGPYTMIMEQPVGGRSKGGGQRLGEMEVWALEAYGAAYTLQEMLTIKSDDFEGRTSITETILDPVWKVTEDLVVPEHLQYEDLAKVKKLKGLNAEQREEVENISWTKDFRYKSGLKFGLGTSDAFRVLLRELQSLCLDVGVYALSAPAPKDKKEGYNLGAQLKERYVRFTEIHADEGELPITKEEIQLCAPGDVEYYREYARQYKSQFGFDDWF
jgi:DNA-directed RNA polymerase subunit beta